MSKIYSLLISPLNYASLSFFSLSLSSMCILSPSSFHSRFWHERTRHSSSFKHSSLHFKVKLRDRVKCVEGMKAKPWTSSTFLFQKHTQKQKETIQPLSVWKHSLFQHEMKGRKSCLPLESLVGRSYWKRPRETRDTWEDSIEPDSVMTRGVVSLRSKKLVVENKT